MSSRATKVKTTVKVHVPKTMDAAIPTKAADVVMLVAVTLCLAGNQAHESTGGMALTGPARPFNMCPTFMLLQRNSLIMLK